MMLFAMSATSVWCANISTADSVVKKPRLAVLDLVDLSENQFKVEISSVIRHDLVESGKWNVVSRDSALKKYTEFNLNPNQICNNSQCSFDIGNILQADYVLYGTTAPLGSMEAITLKLLHIGSAKIIWTKVTESQSTIPSEKAKNWEKAFAKFSHELDPILLNAIKSKVKKPLAVVDLSENSFISRVFFERVCTRIYGSTQYDLMSPTELNELLAALEVNKFSIASSNDNMIGLGQKLGVSNLVYTKLNRDGRSYVYRLSMFDISHKNLVLEMPPQPTEDLVKLLDSERIFFNTLFSNEKEEKEIANVPKVEEKKTNTMLWLSLGALGVGGGLAAYWVDKMGKTKTSNTDEASFLQTVKSPPLPPSVEQ